MITKKLKQADPPEGAVGTPNVMKPAPLVPRIGVCTGELKQVTPRTVLKPESSVKKICELGPIAVELIWPPPTPSGREINPVELDPQAYGVMLAVQKDGVKMWLILAPP